MQNITELSLNELEVLLTSWKFPAFHAKQIFSWIYQKGAISFSAMSNLPLALRKHLQEHFGLASLKLIKKVTSSDGTEKFLLALVDKDLIEAVVIPAEKRATACLSTQVGCKFACKFCASGQSGFVRNLSASEIVEELLFLKNNSKASITHIVFMGTGEPLDNYDFVLKAVRIINDKGAFNIGSRRITISTSGVIPGIKKLSEENLQIELSVSLHAADDNIRSELLPINKKYPLSDLIIACRDYSERTNRQITFEYVLMKGVNSGLLNARKLSRMMAGLRLAKVNLIPANPVEELGVEPPDITEIKAFRDYLAKQGVNVTLRKPRGKDIEAACGQLRLRHAKT